MFKLLTILLLLGACFASLAQAEEFFFLDHNGNPITYQAYDCIPSAKSGH